MMYPILAHQVNSFGDNFTTVTEPSQRIWYPQIKEYFNKSKNMDLRMPNLPDSGLPMGCKKDIWVGYIKENYGTSYTHWIGHSIGGVLGLYLAQENRIDQLILVGPHYLPGNQYHRKEDDKVVEELVPTVAQFLQNANYFKNPLDFEKIKQNVKKIVIFVQKHDPLIPYSQVVELIETLRKHEIPLEVIEDPLNDHFIRPKFKQLEALIA